MQTQTIPSPGYGDKIYLTDGGLETTLVFHDGIDLPCFAAFTLLDDPRGRDRIQAYFRTYLELAVTRGLGFVLESPTWRASRDWGRQLGYTEEQLATLNRRAISLLEDLRQAYQNPETPITISGCIGPRGDGYAADAVMSPAEAAAYHRTQIETLRDAGADLISAFTLPTVEEAIGITEAAARAGIPVVISFTVETDGRLPSGITLGDAIDTVDRITGMGPAYYMVNCAHPSHFDHALSQGSRWLERIHGVRANASKKSHAELDDADTLDAGDPTELGDDYRTLRERLGNLTVLGGCCGTDHRHVEAICNACLN